MDESENWHLLLYGCHELSIVFVGFVCNLSDDF